MSWTCQCPGSGAVAGRSRRSRSGSRDIGRVHRGGRECRLVVVRLGAAPNPSRTPPRTSAVVDSVAYMPFGGTIHSGDRPVPQGRSPAIARPALWHQVRVVRIVSPVRPGWQRRAVHRRVYAVRRRWPKTPFAARRHVKLRRRTPSLAKRGDRHPKSVKGHGRRRESTRVLTSFLLPPLPRSVPCRPPLLMFRSATDGQGSRRLFIRLPGVENMWTPTSLLVLVGSRSPPVVIRGRSRSPSTVAGEKQRAGTKASAR